MTIRSSSGLPTPRTPAVVVSGHGPGPIGVVRSLSRAQIPVILIGDDRHAPAMHSRYVQKVLIAETRGAPLIESLLALAATIAGPAVLILNDDDAVMTVSKHRDELASHFLFRLPSHSCVTELIYKTQFHQLAEARGFPVPRSIIVEDMGDLHRVNELRFPCLVKPAKSTPAYGRRGLSRGYRVSSPKEAENVCRPILAAIPSLIVQEWIEGPDTELYFCLQYRGAGGAVVSSFTGRKLSIWPPVVGKTVACTAAADEHAELQTLTNAVFDDVSFVGMGGIEFKRDVRTGEFLIVEPTVGRVDGQEEVATLHGVNIPLAAYLYEIGAPLPPQGNHPALTIWRDFFPHFMASRSSGLQRAFLPKAKIYDAYWRRYDPVPALFRWWEVLPRAVARMCSASFDGVGGSRETLNVMSRPREI